MIRLFLTASAVAMTFAATPALAQHVDHRHEAGAHEHGHAKFESGRFHVAVDGPAQPIGDVILVPGLSSSPRVWQALTDELKGRYRVHRVHVQGFAGAPVMDNAAGPVAAPVAEDLARYIREQGLSKPAMIGHSMGGTIGMMLAARHPDLVGRLMVVDQVPTMGAMFLQPPGSNPTPERLQAAADMVRTGMLAANEQSYSAQRDATVASMIKTESQRAGPLEDSRRSDRMASINSFHELVATNLQPELARITAPTTVLYVAFEFPGMTPQITDTIYRMSYAPLPGVKLKRIDESAHFIMLDQPAAFAAEVKSFLE